MPAHERGRAKRGFPDGCVNAEGLRFDESVPVKDIALELEGVDGLAPEDCEVIGTEVRCKLAQRAASYEVLRYGQPVIELRESGEILPLARRAIERLVSMHEARWRHILASTVLAMDETAHQGRQEQDDEGADASGLLLAGLRRGARGRLRLRGHPARSVPRVAELRQDGLE